MAPIVENTRVNIFEIVDDPGLDKSEDCGKDLVSKQPPGVDKHGSVCVVLPVPVPLPLPVPEPVPVPVLVPELGGAAIIAKLVGTAVDDIAETGRAKLIPMILTGNSAIE